MSTLPLQFLLMTLAGWVNRSQQDVIEYLQEENRVLREHLTRSIIMERGITRASGMI